MVVEQLLKCSVLFLVSWKFNTFFNGSEWKFFGSYNRFQDCTFQLFYCSILFQPKQPQNKLHNGRDILDIILVLVLYLILICIIKPCLYEEHL